MNYCFKKRVKLFVAYVDFSKAYDRVPRNKLMMCLKKAGCGSAMLMTLVAMYQVTRSMLGMAVITATIGVRQGSPTSCFLFTLYLNALIKMYREKCGDDGFLKWLHVLLLMDDTFIMATSRARLQEKLNILNHFCVSYGMVVNRSKTKFMVLHGDNQDRQPLQLGDLWIDHCDRYTYLGAVFTADGSTNSAIKEHVKERQKHFNKLIMFLNTNKDMPFIAKRNVVEAAFNAALLYGCESWVGGNYHAVNKLYMGAIKCLLGVRVTTTSDVCLIEPGLPPLQALVKHRQQCFFKKMLSERQGMIDDPLIFAMDLTRERNVKLYDVIQQLLLPDHIGNALRDLRTKCWTSEGSKFKTYVQINPDLEVHKTYTKCIQLDLPIPEYTRVAFSRMRLSSHRLRIETGRWARIPP